jgi:hypothetical protein
MPTLTYTLVSSILVTNAVNIIYSLHLNCQMHNIGFERERERESESVSAREHERERASARASASEREH